MTGANQNYFCRRVSGESPQTKSKIETMKTFTKILALAVLAGATSILFVGCASDGNDHADHSHRAATKPYPLTKCLVTDDAFEHGKPYTFVHEGQEIKLCCKDCLADFKKAPSKYLSKLNAPK
jgi:hypothetical protein